ncbi:MAG: 30S ribosomal protein S20 [Candidatus Berkelbacteria bacterium]|nr:30S ribosomal protein S20 [Candidatus Berkelbacteria bacterium]
MPIIKSAIKALKQSRKKRAHNLLKKRALKAAVKKTKTAKQLPKAQSTIDKIAKTGYIHKNKAARLKSRLAKRVASSKPA